MLLGCGCLFALFASAAPRLALLFTWLFTPLVSRAFHGVFLWPFLGLLFLPFTTLLFVICWSPVYGLSGWGWFFVILGFFLDISSYGGSAYGNHDRMRGGSQYQMPA
jgi:hypothetical protein